MLDNNNKYFIRYCLGCGGVLNASSGVVHLANTGNEDETHCIWRIGNVGLGQSYAWLTFTHTLFFFFLQNNLDYVDPQIANLLFEAGQSSTNIYNI